LPGLIGQAHILRVLEEPEAELAGIADPSPQSKGQAEGLGVTWAPDIETLLAQAKSDGVVIATPNQLHVPRGMAAVRAGVPMLLEKPVADDVDSALALATAAEQAGVPILVGHHRHHSPLIRRPREVIASGRLGQVSVATAYIGSASCRRTNSRVRTPGGASRAAAWC
jgi:predicted dehydrogenase